MKVRAIEIQSYFNENTMPITTGEVYEVEDALRSGTMVIVVGDDGQKVQMFPGEYEVVK